MNLSTTAAFSFVATNGGIDTRLLERLFDHTPHIAFFIKDRQGRCVVVNESIAVSLPHAVIQQWVGRDSNPQPTP